MCLPHYKRDSSLSIFYPPVSFSRKSSIQAFRQTPDVPLAISWLCLKVCKALPFSLIHTLPVNTTTIKMTIQIMALRLWSPTDMHRGFQCPCVSLRRRILTHACRSPCIIPSFGSIIESSCTPSIKSLPR